MHFSGYIGNMELDSSCSLLQSLSNQIVTRSIQLFDDDFVWIKLVAHHHLHDRLVEARDQSNTEVILDHWNCSSARIDVPEEELWHLVAMSIPLLLDCLEEALTWILTGVVELHVAEYVGESG